MKIISIISNSGGHTVQYIDNGKAASRVFPLGTKKEDMTKALNGVDEFKQLQDKAKALGVKGWAIIKKKETLLAKIAEAEAGGK